MSDLSRVNDGSRLAYSNSERLGIDDGSTQTGDTGDTGQTTGTDRKSYLVSYIQQIQNDLENGSTQGGSLADKKLWLQQALDMLHTEFPESSGWDPNADQAPVGFQADKHPTSTNHSETEKHFYYREGTGVNVIADRGDPNDDRPTTAEFWTSKNGIYLPDNASDVSYQYDATEHTITVQVNFPDGATKTMIYHDVDRPGFKLSIDASNPDRAKLHLGDLGPAAGKVSVKQHVNQADGSTPSGERVGAKPTGTEDGGDLFDGRGANKDGKGLNLSPLKDGSGQTTTVRWSGDVNLTANSNSEYYKVEYKDGKYLIHVYANDDDFKNGNEKETIEVDAKLDKTLNFDVDPSRITFDPATLGTADGRLDTSKEGASKIHIIADGAVATAPGDTAPAEATGDTATYPAGDATITNDPNSTVINHNMPSPGNVRIVATATDSAAITKTAENPAKYVVTITSPSGKPQVYTIDATQLGQLTVDGIPTSRITFKGLGTSDIKKLNVGEVSGLLAWVNNPATFSSEGGVGLVPTGSGQPEAIDLLRKIGSAVMSGNWDDVNNTVGGWDANNGNDRLRKLFSALWYASGGSYDHDNPTQQNADAMVRFQKLLKLLPPGTRELIKNKAGENANEIYEWQEGHDVFNAFDVVNFMNQA